MRHRILTSLIFVSVIVGITLFYLLSAPVAKLPSAKEVSNSPSVTPSVRPTEDAEKPLTKGAYVDYSADEVATATGTKILFFHASWCPQCRALDEDIRQKGVPSGITIFKTDYDSATDLRQKYGVTLQTTLVKIDNDGNLVEKYVAYNEPTLASVKSHLLD